MLLGKYRRYLEVTLLALFDGTRMTPNSRSVEVSLTPHFEKFIQRKIRSGTYSDASYVVLAALQRLEQDDAIITTVDETRIG